MSKKASNPQTPTNSAIKEGRQPKESLPNINERLKAIEEMVRDLIAAIKPRPIPCGGYITLKAGETFHPFKSPSLPLQRLQVCRWYSVKERVPDDRREVLTWGHKTILGIYTPKVIGGGYLGASRYNRSSSGGRFDIEKSHTFGFSTVTHWAEIIGPHGEETR